MATRRGRRRLGDAFVLPAGKLLAHVLDNLPAPRLAFERGSYDLAATQPQNAAATWPTFAPPCTRATSATDACGARASATVGNSLRDAAIPCSA